MGHSAASDGVPDLRLEHLNNQLRGSPRRAPRISTFKE
jgi:hypothetical protein